MWRLFGCKRITQLENEEITKLYNKVYGDPEEMTKDSELPDDIFAASTFHDEEDKW